MLKVHCPVILGNWIALLGGGKDFLGHSAKIGFGPATPFLLVSSRIRSMCVS